MGAGLWRVAHRAGGGPVSVPSATPEKEAYAPRRADAWMPVFLKRLAKSPNVSAAARAAKIDRKTAYRVRHASEDFAAAWDDALEQGVDALVENVWTRARESDTLAIFMLKSHRPDVYRERTEQAITGDITVKVVYADADPHPAEAT